MPLRETYLNCFKIKEREEGRGRRMKTLRTKKEWETVWEKANRRSKFLRYDGKKAKE
jgi:hypothetical protein